MNLLKKCWIFLEVSRFFLRFLAGLWKNLGKRGIFANESLTQKAQSVKSTPVKRKASGSTGG